MLPNYTDQGIDPETGLGLRERAFVDHLISDPKFSKTRAYYNAGYASGTYANARKDAEDLLNLPPVRAYYEVRLADRAERFRRDAEKVITELAIVAFSNVADYWIDPATGAVRVKPGVPLEALRAVASYEATSTTRVVRGKDADGRPTSESVVSWTGKIKLWDKMKAKELLCKHLGLTSTDLPDLEVLLNRLPPPVAGVLRKLLAQTPTPSQPLPSVG